MDCAIYDGGSLVKFQIPVSVPLEADDASSFRQSAPELKALITVAYHISNPATAAETSIILPHIIQQERELLFKTPLLEDDTLIIDFINNVERALVVSRDTFKERRDRRKAFMGFMAVTFDKHILEHDEGYMAFYIEIAAPGGVETNGNPVGASKENCHAIVAIHIPESFPRKPPVIFMIHPFMYRSAPADSQASARCC
ncbi:hypothetical protein SeMB42_g07897 [Synchytrium endobioticum]|uniref:BRISC and BRCA1-A complex member 2 n=1 Tax=Synchytrium endobioticum TaxID=286115 RepID=A0A507BU85_9FUNG|nr:hypothetical protein SeMB42_g07897 [Synchytrium endobioticum]